MPITMHLQLSITTAQQGYANVVKTWQERKLEKINRDDFDVITRKTRDQSDFIGMLNTLDNYSTSCG